MGGRGGTDDGGILGVNGRAGGTRGGCEYIL